MTYKEACDGIYEGRLVECTREEYINGIRKALQEHAATMIDQKQDVRAMMAFQRSETARCKV